MIAFDRNIVFRDEPLLDTPGNDPELKSISVYGSSVVSTIKKCFLKTEWMNMSGEKGRYLSPEPFHKMRHPVSWALEIKDTLLLYWDTQKEEIVYIKYDAYTAEKLRFWILHTFLPLILELETIYHILHVGAVEVDEKAVLFSAFSFGGKSTLTDCFIRNGYRLLSDDTIGVEKRSNKYYAVPSYPFHRPYRQPGVLGYYVEHFSSGPQPIEAVYRLEKAAPDTEVVITELKGIEKFRAFHYSAFIDFDFMRKEHFAFAAEMAKHIPVYRLTIPWDLERLPEVYLRLKEHIGKL